MSEQLTIEILREKFKEAQEKGEELELCPIEGYYSDKKLVITGFGVMNFMARREGYAVDSESTYTIDYLNRYFKIKQPKDEHEVLYENLTFMKDLNAYRVGFDKNPLHYIDSSFTGRKLLRNKRTGEIVNFDEKLLK